ncbi:hypothetical protein [Magnetospira sp. QH-2]|uniref:hypothetical protein n=1 Tax=Magnetospira sp. (strain QH-2) TaxID=1288970 RepID=UPI0011DDDCB1|nr:hypothetical protein [Magnetospira sp. QH-2]
MNWRDGLAYTLTFPFQMAESRKRVEKELRFFFNVLDKAVFGRRSLRSDAHRCQRINMIEGGPLGDNFHCHGLIRPSSHPEAKIIESCTLQQAMEEIWNNKMRSVLTFDREYFGNKAIPARIEINPAFDNGNTPGKWANYICKTISAENSEALCPKTSWFHDGPVNKAR